MPEGRKLNHSHLSQINQDVYELIGSIVKPIQVNKITRQSNGQLQITNFATLKSKGQAYANAVYQRRYILVTGGHESNRNEPSN